MRSFDFLPITRFSQAPPAGAASKPFARILQPFAQVLDTRRSQMVVLGVELFRATASAAGQVPVLDVQVCDAIDSDSWTTMFSTPTSASVRQEGQFILTLLKSIERGGDYRLGQYLRWAVRFPATVSGSSAVLCARITATEA